MEELAKNYEHTIAALSAFGTWAAVLVSLWLSSSVRKPNLKIFAQKSVLIPSEAQTTDVVDWNKCEDTLGMTIENHGHMTVYITYWSFIWKLPYPLRKAAQQNPYLPDFRSDGLKIEPGNSATISLTNDLPKLRKDLDGLCDGLIFPSLFKRFVQLQVVTSNGFKFRARMTKELRKEILAMI